MRKKSLTVCALLLSLCLMISLSACGDDDSAASHDSGTASTASTASGTVSTGGPAAAPTLEKNSDGLYMIANANDLVTYRDMLEKEMRECEREHPGDPFEATSGAILVADIDMSSICGEGKESWRPIGMGVDEVSANCAGISKVTFLGDGHSIAGLYIKADSTGGGLFAHLESATVSDLTFKNCVLDCDYGAGGDKPLAQYGTGCLTMYMDDTTVKNCVTEDSVRISGKYSVGGFAGVAESDRGQNIFEKCINRASVTGREDGIVGGIVGQVTKKTAIHNCDNYGTISGNESTLGGIVGLASGNSSYAGTILGCVNYGDVENLTDGASSLGGIVGKNNSTVKFCINAGTIKANGGKGYDITDYNNGSMDWCINIGKVEGSSVEDEYAYASVKRRGYSLSPDAPELTDGSLLESGKLGSHFWTQGEKFPVWNGTMP